MSESEAKPESQARSTGVVSVAIMLSRVLGLVRDQILLGWFGTHLNGIFNAAFRTPNMLRDLFAEGALSIAFVTTFSKTIKNSGDEAAWELARKMLTLALCFMTLVAVAGVALAPLLVRLLNPGWDSEEDWRLGTLLAQVMYPFITIVSLAALVMGMLNAKRIFFIPAVASAFFNLGCIAGGVVLAWLMDPDFGHGPIGERALIAFAIGTLIGGLLQLLVQLPALRRAGFRFRPDFGWRTAGVNSVLRLMWPSLLAASGTQINVMLNSIFASWTPGKAQALSWLGAAQRLQQLPLGLFGVAVATVTLPMLARLATEGITPAFRSTLAKGLRLVAMLTLPCAVGLWLLAGEVVSVLFQHGEFNAHDTAMTVGPLRAYMVGLVFYSGIKVLQPAFFSIDKRFVPMVITIITIFTNVTLNSISVFVLGWGHTALAWCTAFNLALNFSVLYVIMGRLAGGLESGPMAATLGRLALALTAMAGVCLLAQHTLLADWEHLRLLVKIAGLGGTVLVAALVYLVLSAKLGVEETREFISIVSRRFGGRGGRA